MKDLCIPKTLCSSFDDFAEIDKVQHFHGTLTPLQTRFAILPYCPSDNDDCLADAIVTFETYMKAAEFLAGMGNMLVEPEQIDAHLWKVEIRIKKAKMIPIRLLGTRRQFGYSVTFYILEHLEGTIEIKEDALEEKP